MAIYMNDDKKKYNYGYFSQLRTIIFKISLLGVGRNYRMNTGCCYLTLRLRQIPSDGQ
jgi:hypothetical protein